MKRVFSLFVIAAFIVAGFVSMATAAETGSAKIRLLVMQAGLNVLVECWDTDGFVLGAGNTILDNTTAQQASTKIQNVGTVTFNISMSITNTGGATLVTTGNPGDAIVGTGIRMAAVFIEWDKTLAISDFAANDILTTSLKAASDPTTGGNFHYVNPSWGIGLNVGPNNERPLGFSIDVGDGIATGTSYDLYLYADVDPS